MRPVLQIEQLSCFFEGLRAVGNLDLAVAPGELLGIIGPNGAGKTTLFNLISGIYQPSSGRILFEENDITGRPPYRIAAAGIARTFQNVRLFKQLTALDNVRTAFYSQVRHGALEAFLHCGRYREDERSILLRSRRLISLLGLEKTQNEAAGSLPYGLQRRLEIARALALSPRLLLLDEPAAGMNPSEVNSLIDLVRRVKAEFALTVILIEHQMPLVMGLCDRLVVLDFGEKIADGRPEEIRHNKKVLEAYLGEDLDEHPRP